MQAKEWPYKPNIVQIELTQGCNRRCKFCGTMGIEKQFHYANIKTISHTCNLIKGAGLNCRILLAGHGEPTLNPNLIEIVKEIRRILPENMIHMFTNGTYLAKRPDKIIDLFAAGLNDLVFDEYSDSRIGKFVRNSEICKKFNIVEQGNGVPLMAEKNIKTQRICITPPIDLTGNTANRKLCNHCGAGMKKLKKPMEQKCSTIFRDFFVRWDGNVAICCNDFRGEYFVCNINDCTSFEQAYFHERLESARKFLMLGARCQVYPCNICNVRAIRPGLLPDARGSMKMPLPTSKDYEIVRKTYKPLAELEKRPWEKS